MQWLSGRCVRSGLDFVWQNVNGNRRTFTESMAVWFRSLVSARISQIHSNVRRIIITKSMPYDLHENNDAMPLYASLFIVCRCGSFVLHVVCLYFISLFSVAVFFSCYFRAAAPMLLLFAFFRLQNAKCFIICKRECFIFFSIIFKT